MAEPSLRVSKFLTTNAAGPHRMPLLKPNKSILVRNLRTCQALFRTLRTILCGRLGCVLKIIQYSGRNFVLGLAKK